MSKITKITSFFLFFVMGFCVNNAYAESCTTVGVTQDKYEADGCSYSVLSRECCKDKVWSAWGENCPVVNTNCSSNQCWNGSYCEAKPSVGIIRNGSCFFTRSCSCVKGSGWKCSDSNGKRQMADDLGDVGGLIFLGQSIYRNNFDIDFDEVDVSGSDYVDLCLAHGKGSPWSGSLAVIYNGTYCSCTDGGGGFTVDSTGDLTGSKDYCLDNPRTYTCDSVLGVYCTIESC